jgi:hypothetical protein
MVYHQAMFNGLCMLKLLEENLFEWYDFNEVKSKLTHW